MPITLPSAVAPNELIQSAWGNGVVDALAEIDLEFVEKAGDTMTGQLSGITPTAAAHLTRKDYVDAKISLSEGEQGPDNAGPTVGAGALTINTVFPPTPGVDGRIHAWGGCTFVQTVSSDVFELILEIEGVTVSNPRGPNAGGATAMSLSASGSAAYTTAGGPIAVLLRIARVSGTGTATISTSTPASYLHVIFVPEP